MDVDYVNLIYVPFKHVPAGHIYVVFRFRDGRKIAISPEAAVGENESFSLLLGLTNTYQLRYFIGSPSLLERKYRKAGRKLREKRLHLDTRQASDLYARMRTRAATLRTEREWYHTISNSCATNILRHLDDVRSAQRNGVTKFVIAMQPRFAAVA